MIPQPTPQPPPAQEPTQHALLVAWGHFAQSLGLRAQLATVPLAQKTVHHTPAAKLLTCLVGGLAGNEHLADLSHGPAPIEHDRALAVAWGLPTFPEASSVSRTLAAANPTTLQALQRVLAMVSQPFLDRALADLRTRAAPLRFDLDLMGRPLTRHSHSYPDAAFGYMDGSLQLGYQLAMVCLQTALYDRQWLAAVQHPGNTPSASCLRELVTAAEARVGLHPHRRPDLVAGRLAALDAAVAAAHAQATHYTVLATAATQQEETLLAQIAPAQATGWRADAATRAALTRQIATLQQRVGRVRQQWAAALTRSERAAERISRLTARRPALQTWHDQLVAENATAEPAPRCIVRVDAGFSSGANLSYLLELGYEVETRANNPAVARALRGRVMPTTRGRQWDQTRKWPSGGIITRRAAPIRYGRVSKNGSRRKGRAIRRSYAAIPIPAAPRWTQRPGLPLTTGGKRLKPGTNKPKGSFIYNTFGAAAAAVCRSRWP
jgi:hypothetical protein